jgi:hypothetical protein
LNYHKENKGREKGIRISGTKKNKINYRVVDLNTNISIFSLNVYGSILSNQVRLSEQIKNKNPKMFLFKEID